MKRLLTVLAAAGLLLLPSFTLAQSQTGDEGPSPISQTLVREGDFALDLAAVLELGEPANEAEAEDMLTKAAISPKNGWIADYPVTPDVLSELEEAVGTAADSGLVKMSREDAEKAFRELATDYGFAVGPAVEEMNAATPTEPEYGDYSSERVGEYGEYSDPAVIENYYYVQGPPVITYYTPPYDYWYLYNWVSYPFWWGSYWYPGYYVLCDFNVVVHTHHHHHRHRDWDRTRGERFVTNHIKDKATNKTALVDPVSRTAVDSGASRHDRRLAKKMDRKSAEAILQKETKRSGTPGLTATDNTARAERRAARQEQRSVERATRLGDRDTARAERREARQEQRSVERATRLGDRNTARAERRAARQEQRSVERATRLGDRDTARSERRAARQERSIERATRLGDSNRSFNSSGSRSADRSFSRPQRSSDGGGRSFSRPERNFGGGGNRSFSRPARGFDGGGGRGGGRGGGHGGGCRGGRC